MNTYDDATNHTDQVRDGIVKNVEQTGDKFDMQETTCSGIKKK